MNGCKPSTGQHVYSQTFVLCGTYVNVQSPHKEALGIVHDQMRRLCDQFNFYNPESELSRLNNSYNEPIVVSPEMIEVLDLAKKMHDISDGAFDASAGVLFAYWKDVIKSPKTLSGLPEPSFIAALKEKTGMRYIRIDEKQSTVTILKRGLKIDLSGIAEGYIIDQVVKKLREKGVSSCLINGGGDIYCLGTIHRKPWTVGIRDPREDGAYFDTLSLTDKAVSTSGGYEQFFTRDGRSYSHLIDPKSGYPVDVSLISTTVVAASLGVADALATASYVMGRERAKKLAEDFSGADEIIIIEKDATGTKTYRFR